MQTFPDSMAQNVPNAVPVTKCVQLRTKMSPATLDLQTYSIRLIVTIDVLISNNATRLVGPNYSLRARKDTPTLCGERFHI